jgi:hypothetical protein
MSDDFDKELARLRANDTSWSAAQAWSKATAAELNKSADDLNGMFTQMLDEFGEFANESRSWHLMRRVDEARIVLNRIVQQLRAAAAKANE